MPPINNTHGNHVRSGFKRLLRGPDPPFNNSTVIRPDSVVFDDEQFYRTEPSALRHRTQLTLFDAPAPWGPFSLFHRDDDWHCPDGAAGAYCPVLPPAWMGNDSAWVVSASCCARSNNDNLHH